MSGKVPRKHPDLELSPSLKFVLVLVYLVLNDTLNAVGFLGHVSRKQNFNAVIFVVVREVVSNVPLDPSDHLLNLASEALVAVLNHSSDVRVRACVLLTEFVPIVGPHLLVHQNELTQLLF